MGVGKVALWVRLCEIEKIITEFTISSGLPGSPEYPNHSLRGIRKYSKTNMVIVWGIKDDLKLFSKKRMVSEREKEQTEWSKAN